MAEPEVTLTGDAYVSVEMEMTDVELAFLKRVAAALNGNKPKWAELSMYIDDVAP